MCASTARLSENHGRDTALPAAGVAFRPTRGADLDAVLPRLASRTLREIDRYLCDFPSDARLANVRAHVEAATQAGRADTFLLNDRPVGIITHTPENDYFYTTALPTEAYFSKAFLKLSRRYNDALVRRLRRELRAYSRSDHSETASWFRLMGFTEIGSDGDARVFVYPITETESSST